MLTHEIQVNETKYSIVITDQIINQVNNLKSLYNAAYEDPESFEQVSAEISSIIQSISNAVKPKPSDTHLDNLIQQVIKTVNDKAVEVDKQTKVKPTTKKNKNNNKKIKSKK